MNIYLIERQDEVGYDEFDSHVVVEETPRLALSHCRWGAIPDPEPKVTKIGTSIEGIAAGVINSSFNAG